MKFTSTLLAATVAIVAAAPSFAHQTYKLSFIPPLDGYLDAMASSRFCQ